MRNNVGVCYAVFHSATRSLDQLVCPAAAILRRDAFVCWSTFVSVCCHLRVTLLIVSILAPAIRENLHLTVEFIRQCQIGVKQGTPAGCRVAAWRIVAANVNHLLEHRVPIDVITFAHF